MLQEILDGQLGKKVRSISLGRLGGLRIGGGCRREAKILVMKHVVKKQKLGGQGGGRSFLFYALPTARVSIRVKIDRQKK